MKGWYANSNTTLALVAYHSNSVCEQQKYVFPAHIIPAIRLISYQKKKKNCLAIQAPCIFEV